MVASYSSAPPTPWMPTARSLGALFAGSAVMFAFTVLNGGSLLPAANEARPIAKPLGSPTSTGPVPGGTIPAPGQSTQWTPGAVSPSDSPLGNLSVSQAPVLEGTDALALADPAEIASVRKAGSENSVAPMQAADDADTRKAETSGPTQTADSRYDGPFHSVLSSVLHVTKGLLR